MSGAATRALQEKGMRLKTEPSRDATALKLDLAGLVRNAFSNDDGMQIFGIRRVLLAQSDQNLTRDIQGAILLHAQGHVGTMTFLDPYEVVLIEGHRTGSYEYMSGLSRAELESLIRDKPIDVVEHSLA